MGTTWPCFNSDSRAEYSWKKIHVVYLVGSAWCRVLWVAQTERDHYWGLSNNWWDWAEHSRKNASTTPNMTKLFSCMIMFDHMLRRRSKSTWKHSNRKFYPSRRILQTLLLPTCSDRWRLSEQHFTSYEDTKNYIDDWTASKDEAFFRRGIHMLPERWEKVASDDHYFE